MTGTQNPIATPATKSAARRISRASSAAITTTGMMAHTSTAPADPNATPPQSSRLALRGQLVTIQHRQRTGQAEQHQPGLEQDGVRGDQAAREDGQHAAGPGHRERAPVPGQQADQRDACGTRRHRQDAPGRHAPGRAGDLGQQRGRAHQQRDAGRLHDDEVAVRKGAVHEAQGAAEVRPVVVLRDAEQVSGPAQQEEPQAHADQREARDDQRDGGEPAAEGGGPEQAGAVRGSTTRRPLASPWFRSPPATVAGLASRRVCDLMRPGCPADRPPGPWVRGCPSRGSRTRRA